MQDHLKIFIQQHRNAFDTAAPGAQGWTGLQQVLDRWLTADGLERTLLANRLLLDVAHPSERIWAGIAAELDLQPTVDPLEQFIRTNRDEFDRALPNAGLWENLETNLPASRTIAKKVTFQWQKTLLRAAAAIVLMAVGAGLGMWYSARSNDQSGMAMSEVSPEYRELEQFYQRDIHAKQQELATFTGNQPEEVHDDLEQMDAAMQELRTELANVPPGNREQVVRAMIENYKAKMAILQRVLERLEPTKTEQKDRKYHEPKRI